MSYNRCFKVMSVTDPLDRFQVRSYLRYEYCNFAGHGTLRVFPHYLPETILCPSGQVISYESAIFASEQACLINLAVDRGSATLKIDGQGVPTRRQVYAKEITHVACCSRIDRKSTRLNSSHTVISYAVFCLKKKI